MYLYLLQEIKSFSHEHGEQRTKDGFPSVATNPCTQHPDPKAHFFSGPHASTAQAVLNLSSYYVYMLPVNLSLTWK